MSAGRPGSVQLKSRPRLCLPVSPGTWPAPALYGTPLLWPERGESQALSQSAEMSS